MSAAPSFTNQRVRLRGLSREVLNGAVGVAGALDAATGRFPVRLEGPRAALDAFPDNIKVKPENLELAPAPPKPESPPEARPARPRPAAAQPGAAGFVDASSLRGQVTDWSAGLSPKEAYVKFTWAYQFRVEDEYTFGGAMFGAYADACGDVARGFPTCGERDFRTFLAGAHKRNALPDWWTQAREVHDRECIAVAREDWGCAVEKSDVQEKFGGLGPLMLRAMAERVTGGAIGTGLGGSRETEHQARYGGGARR